MNRQAQPDLRDFAGAPDEGEFEVVNDPRPVGGDVGDQAAFDQINDVPRQAQLDRVASEHGDDGVIVESRGENCSKQIVETRNGTFR